MDDKGNNHDTIDRLGALLARELDPVLGGLTAEKLAEVVARIGALPPTRGAVKPCLRWQDAIIEREIPLGASVLDLGCGGGELLFRLMDIKGVRGQGVELDARAVVSCVARGVPVFHSNLDDGLRGFSAGNFDYVILEETLQTLHRPLAVLTEMLRVGRHGIVSFPNFAYWRVRLDLAMRGRMPVTECLPDPWYETPNIHLFTLQDFLEWTRREGVRIVHGYALAEGQVRDLAEDDNLYAEEVLLFTEKEADHAGV
jgi:methionine biosynthesis protein MetW